METFYHQSSSLSSIDEGGTEREEDAHVVVVETGGELEIGTYHVSDIRPEDSMSAMELASRSASSIQDDATRRRRRRFRHSRSSSTTSEDSIGSPIASSDSSRRISYECHPDEILMAIAASTLELSIDDPVAAASDDDERGTTSSLPRRGMQNYRNNGGQHHHMSSMLSLIESDLNDSIGSENMYNVLGGLDEAILRSRAGRVRRSSSRRLSSSRSVLAEVAE